MADKGVIIMGDRKYLLCLVVIFVFSILVSKEVFSQKDVGLPPEIEIVAPSNDVRPEIAAFSGKWEGLWDGGCYAVLVVEEIDNQKAKIIYAWGEMGCEPTGKGFRWYIAKVSEGPPAKIEFGERYLKFTFEMKKDLKTIKGLREYKTFYFDKNPVRGRNRVTMKRISE